jgi:hypothetical protein
LKIDHVYICSTEHDLRYTQCCVASIRRWYPDIPITLVKDDANGPYDTSELEQAWDVAVFVKEQGQVPGLGWGKLEPMFLPGRRRCLILDSDIVFLGRLLERLQTIEADFVVESVGGWASLVDQHYFDLDALHELDPEFEFPGYTFNTGQLVATTGILTRSDFEPFVDLGTIPERIRRDVFPGREQGILNYLLTKKAQQGELTLERVHFMLWGWTRFPSLGTQAIHTRALTSRSPYPYLVHWHGRKREQFFLMRNRRLLHHFEACYYSRVPNGRRKRRVRSAKLLVRLLTPLK